MVERGDETLLPLRLLTPPLLLLWLVDCCWCRGDEVGAMGKRASSAWFSEGENVLSITSTGGSSCTDALFPILPT